MKFVIIGGTRPEWIKLASTIKALDKEYEVVTINTGQHSSMSKDILKDLDIKPSWTFNTMGLPIQKILTESINGISEIITLEHPDYIIVQGDTISTLAGALAGFYTKIPVIHLEAGSRSNNFDEPYPEEMNRVLVDRLSTHRLCMCQEHVDNLRKEGMDGIVIGNTTIDAISLIGVTTKEKKNQILITAHRRENWEHMHEICTGIKNIALFYPEFTFKFIMHANPKLQEVIKERLEIIRNVQLLQPMSYKDFLEELSQSYLLVSDSGGASQEAPSLGVPVVMLRNVCENELLITNNLAVLVGTNSEVIFDEIEKLINVNSHYNSMIGINPYGNGKSYEQILNYIKKVKA